MCWYSSAAVINDPTADISISNLCRSYGGTVAVDAINLVIRRGEIVSILGPSGCGKSTLLHLVAGHLRPDSGTITIAGRVVADGDSRQFVDARHRRVGMVFQDFALFPHLNVLDNVAFGIAARGLRARRHKIAAAQALLERFGLADLGQRMPAQLSGGQQQRVAIARAIAAEPHVLLLDEPFASLDAALREATRAEVVGMLRDTGLTCLFVTHDQEEALSISDRVAVMRDGAFLQVDSPERLYTRPVCCEVATFLGRTNVLPGIAEAGHVATEVGTWDVELPHSEGHVDALIRPELLGLRRAGDDEAVATVVAREFRGHDVLYELRLDSGRTAWAHRPATEMVDAGDRVAIIPQPDIVVLCEHGDGEEARDQVDARTGLSRRATDVAPAPQEATSATR